MASNKKAPTVTVLVCSYKSGASILPTIQSILAQTYTDFQLLIIDDASGDETPQVIRRVSDSRILLIENATNLGVAGCRNKGVSLAKGRYIAHCDHDDIWASRKLEKQVAFLSSHPEYGLVSTNITRTINDVTDCQGEKVQRSSNYLRWSLLLDSTFAHSAIMYRTDLPAKNNLCYREGYTFADDWDFFLQISKITKIASIPEPLVTYRLHDQNWSNRATEKMWHNGRAIFHKEINYWINRSVSKEDTDSYFDIIVSGIPSQSSEQLMRSGRLSHELCEAFISKIQPNANDSDAIRALASDYWWKAVTKSASLMGPKELRLFFSPETPNWKPPCKRARFSAYIKSALKTILSR